MKAQHAKAKVRASTTPSKLRAKKGNLSAPNFTFHPVAEMFPLIEGEAFDTFCEDLKANGQREKALVIKGDKGELQIVDGRNRYRACQKVGRPFEYEIFSGKGSLAELAASLNFHRRHLTPSQKAAAAVAIEEQYAVEAAERQTAALKQNGAANLKVGFECNLYGVQMRVKEVNGDTLRFVDAKTNKGGFWLNVEDVRKLLGPDRCGKNSTTEADKGRARDLAARICGVNPHYISDAKFVRQHDPKLFAEMVAGTKTISEAKRAVQRAVKEQVVAKRAVELPPLDPKYINLVEGDCLKWLPTFPRRSVSLIFADPPYNIGINYGNGSKADQLPPEKFHDWCGKWIGECAELLKADGSMWVLINDENAAQIKLILDSCLHYRAWVKWYETFGVNCSKNFNRTSRHLFYYTKSKTNFTFHASAFNRPSDRQAKYGDKRAAAGGKIWDDVWGVNPPIPRLVDNAKERVPRFPTQIPLALVKPIVEGCSDPRDVVLDPFSGSGTTAVACAMTGRMCQAIEKNAEYAELSRRRIAAALAERSKAS
jgi:DNA modification methylase